MSDFEEKVYCAIKKIPVGKVTTYKEIASFLGVKAYRAVGRACAGNPHAPEVPCHRVVKSAGQLGGYSGAGGVAAKKKLLKQEGVKVENGRVKDFKKIFFRLVEK